MAYAAWRRIVKAWVEKGASYNHKGLEKFKNLKEDEVKKIVVIRHAALGDMVQTRPFLYELKRLFPKAKILLSIFSTYQVGAPVDLVDEVQVVDRKNQSLFYLRNKAKELKDIDVLFDLAATSKSYFLSFFSTAKVKLGFPYRVMPWLYDIRLLRSDFKYEAELLIDFLSLFGHKAQYPLNFFWPQHSNESSNKEIAFFMSSSTLNKNYPQEKVFTIISELAQHFTDYTVTIVQGVGESEKFLDLYESLKKFSNIRLRETTSLDELIQWMSSISLLISNDTGVRHVALGTHTPTLGIFNITVPYRNWPRYERQHECLFNKDGSFIDEKEVISSAIRMIEERAH